MTKCYIQSYVIHHLREDFSINHS